MDYEGISSLLWSDPIRDNRVSGFGLRILVRIRTLVRLPLGRFRPRSGHVLRRREILLCRLGPSLFFLPEYEQLNSPINVIPSVRICPLNP